MKPGLLIAPVIVLILIVSIPSASQTADHPVISEFRTNGPGGASDEFIELYNPTGTEINIAGWKIVGSSSSGTTSTRVTFAPGTKILPYAFLLIAHATKYTGAASPDTTYSTGISDDGGIALVRPDNSIADQVGMSIGSAFGEGTRLNPHSSASSYERKAKGNSNSEDMISGFDALYGNSYDTADNTSDFVLQPNPGPQNRVSVAEVLPVVLSHPIGRFNSVQEGLAAALPGADIMVSPGTYKELLVARTPDVVLKAVTTATLKAPNSDVDAVLTVAASGVTIERLEIDAGNSSPAALRIDADGVSLIDVVAMAGRPGATAVVLGNGNGSGFTMVRGSAIAPDGAGIDCEGSTRNRRRQFTIRGVEFRAGIFSVRIHSTANGIVEDNTFADDRQPEAHLILGDVDSIVTMRNRFLGPSDPDRGRAISIQNGPTSFIGAVNIGENTFRGSSVAILIDTLIVETARVEVHENTIENSPLGILNRSNTLVHATNNWWGDASGPSGGAIDPFTGVIARGSGSAVRGLVHFDPWTGKSGGPNGLDLYLSADRNRTDPPQSILTPRVGMGTGTTHGVDDWTYERPTLTFFVVPRGLQSVAAGTFVISWDPSLAALAVTSGDRFDFFAAREVEAGRTTIDVGASNNLNVSLDAGAYLARLDFTITRPGAIEVNIENADFRYYNRVRDELEEVAVTTHQGTIKFYLGDFVSSGGVTTIGDAIINFEDLTPFSLGYFGEADGDPSGYKAKFDIGPTPGGKYFALPAPDGKIEFEDLVIFSIAYGKSSAGELPKTQHQAISFSIPAVEQSRDGSVRVPIEIEGPIVDVRALSVRLSYSSEDLEFLGAEKAGALNRDDSFLIAGVRDGIATLDAAVIGLDRDPLRQEGPFAYLDFQASNSADSFSFRILEARARTSGNGDIPVEVRNPESLQLGTAPRSFELQQNYPNPFNPSTTITYEVPDPTSVEISIYNLLGEHVAVLVSGVHDPGVFKVTWDGTNTRGLPAPSGIYLYRMRASEPVANGGWDVVTERKMLLLR